MEVKLYNSELKVMDVLWQNGEQTAGQLAKTLKEQVGWNRNTTYTVIKKLIDKGAVERFEPNFGCRSLITKEQVQRQEADELIGKLFDGSAELFLSTYVSSKNLSPDEIEKLKQIVEKLK